MATEAVNPAHLPRPPTFSRAVVVTGPGRTIYVAGIGPVDEQGRVDRAGDMARQADVCFAKLVTVLDAAGATAGDVVQLTVYVTDMAQMSHFHDARSRHLTGAVLPAISGMQVVALAHPDWTIEIDGVAFVDA